MCPEREIEALVARHRAVDAAWMAYEAAVGVAKAEWLRRGGGKRDRVYEAARRLAWGEYEKACTRSFDLLAE